ncbi:hypothetical protein P7C70_g2674, partial [Phenoliferia sp. Uapishka_3]
MLPLTFLFGWLLDLGLANQGQQTVISLLSTQPQLLENLRTALLGQYDIILSLLSTLDHGSDHKKLVDCIVDHCDILVNLRESVLDHRVRYAATAALDEETSKSHRSKALAALERPVQDLSLIAEGAAGGAGASEEVKQDLVRNGGEVIGDEWARQIVRNRSGIILRAGMILKSDQWRSLAEGQEPTVRGTINFRRVPKSNLYGLSQPTQDGIERVLENVRNDMKGEGKIVWINLREEPLLYINGTPYVLRQEAVSLRNVKSYAGISSTRLELLEERLKSDVIAELKAFDGRLLLHTEAERGAVHPVWEVVEHESSIKTLREIMDDIGKKMGIDAMYRRIPITAEKSPDFSDVKEIVEMVAKLDVERTAVIVNCQLGRGRSTRAQVLITLVQRWIKSAGHRLPTTGQDNPRSARLSYAVINNLLRTIRSGQEVKHAVDAAITACSEPYDLLDSIERSRQSAEDAKLQGDEEQVKIRTERGIQNLRAYYFLILFASFLNDSKAETWRQLRETASYESYVRDRPVFKTIERELDSAGKEALVPLEEPLAAGNALSDEVAAFVAKRSGRILSAFTLLKSDYFVSQRNCRLGLVVSTIDPRSFSQSGLQKMSLPEKIEGAPNFRRTRLFFTTDAVSTVSTTSDEGTVLYGCGMATVDGMRRALERMGARTKRIFWTGMREEPGSATLRRAPGKRRDDCMEIALKQDLIKEAEMNGGKILLHDEIQEEDGSFTVTATWEDIKPDEIMTPKEVYAKMRSEGLNVDYARLPVTDEQAPIPGVYSTIEERVSDALTGAQPDSIGLGELSSSDHYRSTTQFNTISILLPNGSRTVAAALVSNILFGHHTLFDITASLYEEDGSSEVGTWDGREAEPYLQGEYKLVLQLVAVLQYGKLAKKLTDRAIDSMEGVQNLRKAVYDFKLRVEASDAGSKKQAKLFDQAMNYLFRYVTLILFADYLLEKASLQYEVEEEDQDQEHEAPPKPSPLPPFKQWLGDRREIKHILSRRTLE